MGRPAEKRTGFFCDEGCAEFRHSFDHPESPERLSQILAQVRRTGLLESTEAVLPVRDRDEIEAALKLLHSDAHIDSVNQHPVIGPAARLALGGALAAVKEVGEGRLRNAFCALRPPGHHAHDHGADFDGPGLGEGFCFFNHVAVCARFAQKILGFSRILIVDFDYHHGNGTEDFFYEDDSVFFFSTHDEEAYPGTGRADRLGDGRGLGYNLNAPLPAGAGDAEILAAFREKLLPAADRFKPDFILVSAGFDSREDDPIGLFQVTDEGFRQITCLLTALADVHCGGRLVALLEGGYNTSGQSKAVAAMLACMIS